METPPDLWYLEPRVCGISTTKHKSHHDRSDHAMPYKALYWEKILSPSIPGRWFYSTRLCVFIMPLGVEEQMSVQIIPLKT